MTSKVSEQKLSIAQSVAHRLLAIQAVELRPDAPFTWASGWLSPIYCDNRKTLSYPEHRSYIKQAFALQVSDRYPDAEVVAGVATGAISWGALVADELGLPFVYVRSSAKDHGKQNLIEGYLPEGARIVVIEDLISTGGSSMKAVEALQAAGAQVEGLMAVYTHGFADAEVLFAKSGVEMRTLTDYNEVIRQAVSAGYVSERDLEMLAQWRENPSQWGR
ncbi:orotate phosphoribosyltransferase [Porphyromonas sp.]|uniref:orotate phosphoribosyltransferase n=1 Tax=Porphyromonas sp. TaxID=1924944 RepID=UPI003994AC8A